MEYLFVIKLSITVTLVVGLSLLAEYSSPKLAGILSGCPIASAILLFFYGLENGPEFAAQSALYNMIGLAACMTFLYFYYRASISFDKYNIVASSIVAFASYSITVYILHLIDLTRVVAVLIPVCASFLYLYLLKDIDNVEIENKITLSHKVLLIRALIATAMVITISSMANIIGSTWAGLFAAFPIALFPLVLILHYSYSKEHAHTVIKNVPTGILSSIVYSLTLSFAYPSFGVYYGTLISYSAAIIYLICYVKITERWKLT